MTERLIPSGVASHEGRILVMTTNSRENLDPALIRPGRVDYEVRFDNASKKETQELFKRMYTSSAPVTREKPEEELSAEDLHQIGKEFSEKVPEKKFSPAEIQGFLLKQKTDPRRALQEVEAWVKEYRSI